MPRVRRVHVQRVVVGRSREPARRRGDLLVRALGLPLPEQERTARSDHDERNERE